MEQLSNDFETELDGAIDDSQTTFDVVSVTGAPGPNFRIRVGDELMLVTGIATLTLTVEREIEGTTAAAHSSGAAVTHVLTKGGLDTYSRESGQMVKAEVEDSDVLVVPAGHQLLVGNGYTISGTLQLDGDLFVVG